MPPPMPRQGGRWPWQAASAAAGAVLLMAIGGLIARDSISDLRVSARGMLLSFTCMDELGLLQKRLALQLFPSPHSIAWLHDRVG